MVVDILGKKKTYEARKWFSSRGCRHGFHLLYWQLSIAVGVGFAFTSA
jgi:hypothetical protein